MQLVPQSTAQARVGVHPCAQRAHPRPAVSPAAHAPAPLSLPRLPDGSIPDCLPRTAPAAATRVLGPWPRPPRAPRCRRRCPWPGASGGGGRAQRRAALLPSHWLLPSHTPAEHLTVSASRLQRRALAQALPTPPRRCALRSTCRPRAPQSWCTEGRACARQAPSSVGCQCLARQLLQHAAGLPGARLHARAHPGAMSARPAAACLKGPATSPPPRAESSAAAPQAHKCTE